MRKLMFCAIFFVLFFQNAVFSQHRDDSFFKDGDRINFIGNSITHGTSGTGRFHNFILLYYATRFPNSKVIFYNSGKWGDNANSFLQRMNNDILSKGANWSVVMAGMNDVNRELYAPERQGEPNIETLKQNALNNYRGYLRNVIVKLLAANTNVILQKPSIYDETGDLTGTNRPGVNVSLQKCTIIIDELAAEFNLKTIDYWNIMNTINQQLQQTNIKSTIVSNDRIHPASPGNFVMAYQFLKSTNAPKYVANIEIENNSVIKSEFCTITNLNATGNSLTFKYKAESLPFPVAVDAEPALALVPFNNDLNKETLKITTLAEGKYALNIDGSFIGSFTANELRQGINLAQLKNTPQYLQALQVKAKTDAYRDQYVLIRDIKFIEINYLPQTLWTDFAAAQAHIQNLIITNSSTYTNQKNRFDAYLINKPNEAIIEQGLNTLANEIFTINKPVERNIEIKQTAQTHIWEFNDLVVNDKVEGWSIINYINAQTANGVLKLTASKTNCLIKFDSPDGYIDPQFSNAAIIRLKNGTSNTLARFYWWTDAVSAAYIEFPISANDTDFKEYTIYLSEDSRWSGDINIIRFDVPSPVTAENLNKNVEIDYAALSAIQHEMTPKTPAPFGVNLAGAEFGEIGEPHYSYPTTAELDYFKQKGLKLFRLPFKWERIQPILNGNLDNEELTKMKTFVSAAQARGLLVILDLHNYGRRKISGTEYIIGSAQLSTAHVADVWTRLANEFKSYKNIWGYGIMNEPHDMLASTPWASIAQTIITAIRSIDTETSILVGGDSWSSAQRWPTASNNLKDLIDPANKLIFEAHVYFDKDASGKYQNSYEVEEATPNTGINRVTPFINWLTANNLKGFIGEYGVPDNDPRWLTVLDNMLVHLQSKNINGTYWAAGPRWGTYTLSVEPRNGQDRPQISVLEKYKVATDSTLPVSLLSFTGKTQFNSILLNWKTATELNNSHFDILHSADGKLFGKLATVKANNEPDKVFSYNFKHQYPILGTNYYQLKQFDFDGNTSGPTIISVNFQLEKPSLKVYQDINKAMNFMFEVTNDTNAKLTITDLAGRRLITQDYWLQSGKNILEIKDKLAYGVYVATLTTATERLSAKFFVQD
ncbi:cellulase family glycosylhydrolase [Pedobacter helvus]|uniref:Cellulase family glycosylhydrolase n=1 Tax=Pedobacter helvus TaxID=2563444 RepID=A0ABW9JHS2_9SPHI|nr:cellulase family glycosylhydrolase [Pedobacter ureilyticus]